jgi:hypothetical protein
MLPKRWAKLACSRTLLNSVSQGRQPAAVPRAACAVPNRTEGIMPKPAATAIWPSSLWRSDISRKRPDAGADQRVGDVGRAHEAQGNPIMQRHEHRGSRQGRSCVSRRVVAVFLKRCPMRSDNALRFLACRVFFTEPVSTSLEIIALAVLSRHPEHIALRLGIEEAGGDEEEIREAVDVFQRRAGDDLARRSRPARPSAARPGG